MELGERGLGAWRKLTRAHLSKQARVRSGFGLHAGSWASPASGMQLQPSGRGHQHPCFLQRRTGDRAKIMLETLAGLGPLCYAWPMESLLDLPPLPLSEALVIWVPNWLAVDRADAVLDRLRAETTWDQPTYQFQGRSVPMPRQVAWHGDSKARYGYSGISHQPAPWNDTLTELRAQLTDQVGVPFNSVLVNRYRDGNDSVAWHADDERELGPEPVIASVSLGATRTFALKPKAGGASVRIELTHGGLLLMAGATQDQWLHAVPKTARPVGERINLTFRHIFR